MSFHYPDDLSFLSQGLIGQLRKDAQMEWQSFTFHPFVVALGEGTLPEEDFKRFLMQDYLYLLHYARAYALAIFKSDLLEDMRSAAQIVSALLETEMALHISYCQQWKIDEQTILAQPESLELLAYSRYMLDCGQKGDLLDLLVTLAPCMVGYAEIGLRLYHDPSTVRKDNPYWSWIEVYGGDVFFNLLKEGVDKLEDVGRRYGASARYVKLAEQFRMATKLEAAFWYAGKSAVL